MRAELYEKDLSHKFIYVYTIHSHGSFRDKNYNLVNMANVTIFKFSLDRVKSAKFLAPLREATRAQVIGAAAIALVVALGVAMVAADVTNLKSRRFLLKRSTTTRKKKKKMSRRKRRN